MKNKTIPDKFKCAFNGILSALKSEINMKIHLFAALCVTLAGLLFKINKWEWIICIIAISLVISAELINTAIETVVDIICPEINENARKAKDVAAGAVLVLAIGAAIIGFMIFLPKITG